MVNVELTYNKGFKWYDKENCYFKGYFYGRNNKYHSKESSISFLSGKRNISDISMKLNEANGIFSIIYNSKDICYAAVDRVRSFPLFYTKIGYNYWISDAVETLIKHKTNIEFNKEAIKEFLATGYVTGKETLIQDVFQIQAGEVMFIENSTLNTSFYHTYLAEEFDPSPQEQLYTKLDITIQHIFKRLANNFRDRPIIVPLSGGYDSRLIAVMLKKMGIKDIICFTYGRKYNNREITISKEVAKKLNYRWHFIEYNDKLINNYIESEVFQNYYKFSANYTSMFFMQEYFAIKNLWENNILKENSIIIPGHAGDFLAGSHLNYVKKDISRKNLIKKILQHNYSLLNYDKNHQALFKKRIENTLLNIHGHYNYQLYENWDHKERQSKFIVNSANIYNFFGYEHLMPLWDRELVDFFCTLPYPYKKYKFLYDHVLKGYFSQYSLNFSKELQVKKNQVLIQHVRNHIKKFIPDITKYKRLRKNDWAFYNEITRKMVENIKEKGFYILKKYNQYNALITHWYISMVTYAIKK